QLLSSLGAIASGVASAVSFSNPALGIALAAGSDFTGQLLESVRKRNIFSKMRKISVTTTETEAMKCALESMADKWSRIKDAEAFVLYKAGLRNKPIEDQDLASSIRLFDKEVPA